MEIVDQTKDYLDFAVLGELYRAERFSGVIIGPDGTLYSTTYLEEMLPEKDVDAILDFIYA